MVLRIWAASVCLVQQNQIGVVSHYGAITIGGSLHPLRKEELVRIRRLKEK